jgi:hypothetical protein
MADLFRSVTSRQGEKCPFNRSIIPAKPYLHSAQHLALLKMGRCWSMLFEVQVTLQPTTH